MTDIWTGEKALERQIAGTPAGAGMDAARCTASDRNWQGKLFQNRAWDEILYHSAVHEAGGHIWNQHGLSGGAYWRKAAAQEKKEHILIGGRQKPRFRWEAAGNISGRFFWIQLNAASPGQNPKYPLVIYGFVICAFQKIIYADLIKIGNLNQNFRWNIPCAIFIVRVSPLWYM